MEVAFNLMSLWINLEVVDFHYRMQFWVKTLAATATGTGTVV